jgi:hypothetical protein
MALIFAGSSLAQTPSKPADEKKVEKKEEKKVGPSLVPLIAIKFQEIIIRIPKIDRTATASSFDRHAVFF